MKQKIILFAFLIFSIFSVNVFATEQTSDLLIIGENTVFLKTFPLEQLEMKYRPFGVGEEGKYSNTNCWRGYRAVWKIIDEKLFLEKIIQCNNSPGEENIVELFEKNGIQYQEKDGMILADWCTLDFYRMTSPISIFDKNRTYLYSGWDKLIKRKKKIILQIENGLIRKNKL